MTSCLIYDGYLLFSIWNILLAIVSGKIFSHFFVTSQYFSLANSGKRSTKTLAQIVARDGMCTGRMERVDIADDEGPLSATEEIRRSSSDGAPKFDTIRCLLLRPSLPAEGWVLLTMVVRVEGVCWFESAWALV